MANSCLSQFDYATFSIWHLGITLWGRNPIHKVMPVMLLLPLTGLSTAIFLLGEEPTKQVFIGGAIILFGIGMILFSHR